MFRTKGVTSVVGLAVLAAAVVTVTVFAVRLAQPGPVEAESGRACSIEDIAGSWLFATQVGQLTKVSPSGPIETDITALGTMNIDREGEVIGTFDNTLAKNSGFPGAFNLGVPFGGSVTVNPDCTGTLTFVTGSGAERTDSIAVLSNNEMWGMSQDPENLWTYEVRRIPGQPRQ